MVHIPPPVTDNHSSQQPLSSSSSHRQSSDHSHSQRANMRFTSGALAFGALALQFLSVTASPVVTCDDDCIINRDPSFDMSRIENYHDKKLLCRINNYFVAFAIGDFDGTNEFYSDDFHITDIRTNSFPFSCAILTLICFHSSCHC